ncbi:MAG: hypothetical protein JXA49_04610 [Actinobacteria bacterium]|nr:hypothetical protein [Actinomycetota bacterium]
MLEKIIEKLEAAGGPVTLKELSREMDIEAQALRGMLEFLNRKGRLTFDFGTCEAVSPGYCKDCHQGCTIRKKK